MTEYSQLAISLVVYRIASLLVGVACIHWGYRLLSLGLGREVGELSTSVGNNSLSLRGAPGIFFALFGAGIVVFSLSRGIEFERVVTSSAAVSPQPTIPNMELPEIRGIIDKLLKGEVLTTEEVATLREFKRIEIWRSRALMPAG